MQPSHVGGMGNPNGFKCPKHGLLLVDTSGAGHVHDGEDHGSWTTRCPHFTNDIQEYYRSGGLGFDCRYERTVSVPCPEWDA